MAQNPWTAGHVVLAVVIVAAIVCLGITSFIRVGGFFTSASSGPAISGAPSCRAQAQTFLRGVGALAREWDDANEIAGQTTRVALPSQIQSLRALRYRAEDLSAPQCALMVKHQLVDAMDTTIEGYIAFLGRKEADAHRYFAQAQRSMDGVAEAIAALE